MSTYSADSCGLRKEDLQPRIRRSRHQEPSYQPFDCVVSAQSSLVEDIGEFHKTSPDDSQEPSNQVNAHQDGVLRFGEREPTIRNLPFLTLGRQRGVRMELQPKELTTVETK